MNSSDGLLQVRAQIARACHDAGRDPATVTLVAVSKTRGADSIEPVIAAGQRVFGENRVQEAKAKWPPLLARHGGLELHLVGTLQSNKAREAVALFDAIHSVDRESLAVTLGKATTQAPAFCRGQYRRGAAKRRRVANGGRCVSGRLPRPLRPDNFRPDVHPAARRTAGAPFCANGQNCPAQWTVAAVDGNEQRLCGGHCARRHASPGRDRYFRRPKLIGALIVNDDPCFATEFPGKHPQCPRLQRHAARGRGETRSGHMDKDRAAPTSHPRPGVVVDLDNDVVEPVLAPQPVAWFNGRPPERAIVPPVSRIFAPGVGRADPAGRQRGPRQGKPVRPPPQSRGPERTARGAAIALALIGLDTAAAERDWHAPRAGAKKAPRWPAGSGPDMNGGDGRSGHSVGGGGDFPTAACSCILTCSTSR
jgi:hypothetical protein